MKKLIMAVVAALSLTLIPAAAAHASVPVTQIQSGIVASPGVYLNDDHGTVGYNNPIISFGAVTNGDEDFEAIAVTYPGRPPELNVWVDQFEYAPNGSPSGYCLSVPAFTYGTAMVLRQCAAGGNSWQDMVIDDEYSPAGPYDPVVFFPAGANGTGFVDVTDGGVNAAPVLFESDDSPSGDYGRFVIPGRV